jgi:hypothetical protein
MSEIKVDKLSPQSGTELTLGDASDDFLLPSGAEIKAQSGSTITVESGASIVNSGTATGFGATGADTSLSNLVAAGEKLVCQAWAMVDGTGTAAISDSGGINGFSSLTDNGTGDYTLSFTSTMANATYTVCGSNIGSAGAYHGTTTSGGIANTTSALTFEIKNIVDHANYDNDNISIVVFGD